MELDRWWDLSRVLKGLPASEGVISSSNIGCDLTRELSVVSRLCFGDTHISSVGRGGKVLFLYQSMGCCFTVTRNSVDRLGGVKGQVSKPGFEVGEKENVADLPSWYTGMLLVGGSGGGDSDCGMEG